MKRVRLTVDPGDADLPLTFVRAAESDDFTGAVSVVNWNVTSESATFLLRIEGSLEGVEPLLQADDAVTEYEIISVGEQTWYALLAGQDTGDARELWEQFKFGHLLTVPPVEWNDDGTYTFALVGTEADVQSAVADLPPGVGVTVESVGGTGVADDGVLTRLTPRQRETLDTAVELGYYDVPRTATVEDLAADLDRAPSTVGEHLQKAEATVIRGLLRR
jgi:hypothetical protein